MLFEDFLWDVEVNFAAGDGEAEASWGVGVGNAGGVGEELDKELMVICNAVLSKEDGVFLGSWEALEVASDGGDDSGYAFELLGADRVVGEFWGPFLGDEEA